MLVIITYHSLGLRASVAKSLRTSGVDFSGGVAEPDDLEKIGAIVNIRVWDPVNCEMAINSVAAKTARL